MNLEDTPLAHPSFSSSLELEQFRPNPQSTLDEEDQVSDAAQTETEEPALSEGTPTPYWVR